MTAQIRLDNTRKQTQKQKVDFCPKNIFSFIFPDCFQVVYAKFIISIFHRIHLCTRAHKKHLKRGRKNPLIIKIIIEMVKEAVKTDDFTLEILAIQSKKINK